MTGLVVDIQQASASQEADYVPDRETMRYWCETVFRHFDVVGELLIRIVDANEIHQLNQQYRNKNKPTNVLSFASEVPDWMKEASHQHPVGDLILCHSIINEEANRYACNTEAYWAHITVHGCLHLLGFDHEIPEEAVIMEEHETCLLTQLGYQRP